MHKNHITQVEYKGGNQAVLSGAGFQSNEWLTFLQAREVKRTIRKGSKGVRLMTVIESVDTKKNNQRTAVRFFTVFNLEQTEITK